MKKFLSLVLALVMTMSLVTVSAGAKDFTDSSKITYSEAVDVMSAVKVIDGYAEGDFRPTATLTRGAAAKIICNLILGPTTASALVADAAPYKDVPTNHTFAGYIAYCQKEGIISGYADGTFKPANSLTGYAFMKMLLGALGYDSAIEGYTGANWSINVAKRALNIGLDDDLVGDFNGVKAVNREEACLYALNTLTATMVEYEKNSTVTVGNITIKDQSSAKDMANTGKTDGNIDKDGKMPKMKEALLADAVGTVAGACTGTSTVTTFIESGSGVEAGGRTGLTALTTAVMFLLCMFIAPIAALIPAPATSAALIYVGILMLSGLKNVDWDDILQVIPVALMLIFMPITGSIGHGIGMALISYSVVAAFTGKAKEVSILTYVLSALFLAKFFIIV